MSCRKHELNMPCEDFAVLLKHDAQDLKDSVELSLSREENGYDELCPLHQLLLLQSELRSQEVQGLISTSFPCQTAMVIANCKMLCAKNFWTKPRAYCFSPCCIHCKESMDFLDSPRLAKVHWHRNSAAFWGQRLLSEPRSFTSTNATSRRLGKSNYTFTTKEQALSFFHELEGFARAHYWLRVITIESLHRAKVTQLLKTWLEDKFQVVYIHVNETRRIGRSLIPLERFYEKERLKHERGVCRISEAADLVLDNNGPLDESVKSLLRFVESNGPVTPKIPK